MSTALERLKKLKMHNQRSARSDETPQKEVLALLALSQTAVLPKLGADADRESDMGQRALDALDALAAHDWQHDEGMPERVILVRDGRLTDSCLFRSEAGSRAFMALIAHGFTSNQAFHVACAIEDGEHDPVKLETIARAA